MPKIDKVKTPATITFELWFSIPNFLYRTIGFVFEQHSQPANWRFLYYLLLAFELTAHAFTRYYMFQDLFNCIAVGDKMGLLVVASYLGFAFDTNVKGLAFILNLKSLRHVYEALRNEFPANDSKIQKDFHVEQHFLPKRLRQGIGFYFITFWFFSMISPFVSSYLGVLLSRNETAEFAYLKPIPIEYDFDYRQPRVYACVYILEVLNLHFTTVMSMGTDVWLVCFVSQICMHLDYISHMLENYQPKAWNSREDCEFLHSLIRKHQLMHDLHKTISNAFGISLVINVLTSMGVFCLLGIDITINGLGIDFLKFLSFFFFYIMQFYYVCSYGQKLKTLSENIAKGAFQQSWYNGSQVYKREILFIMRRSQKQMELSASGFSPITLDTFQFVMTMSYRVFAVLHTMLNN